MTDKLRNIKVFSDILYGYSEGLLNDRRVYIKHFSPIDEYELEKIKYQNFLAAVDKKIPTEQERLDILIKEKLWSKDKDREIAIKKNEIEGANLSKKNLFLISQINQREKEIKELQRNLDLITFERDTLIGLTAERYSEKIANNYFIYSSFYKNKELNDKLYAHNDFEDLDELDISELVSSFNSITDHLKIENIKKAALSNFFQSPYSLAENAYHFMGKPVSTFTYYQTSMISYGSYYKYILGELGDKVNDDYKNDPEKLEILYTSSKNIKLNKDKNLNKNVEYFGVTPEDESVLNIDNNKADIEAKLLQEKGEITMDDMLKYNLF